MHPLLLATASRSAQAAACPPGRLCFLSSTLYRAQLAPPPLHPGCPRMRSTLFMAPGHRGRRVTRVASGRHLLLWQVCSLAGRVAVPGEGWGTRGYNTAFLVAPMSSCHILAREANATCTLTGLRQPPHVLPGPGQSCCGEAHLCNSAGGQATRMGRSRGEGALLLPGEARAALLASPRT